MIKDGKTSALKADLVDHFDYEAVSQPVWSHLYSWYSADYCVFRYMRKDRLSQCRLALDLYPGNISASPARGLYPLLIALR